MKVYVNDTLRLDFGNDENPIPGGYVKSHYYFGRYLNYEQGRRYEKIFTALSIIEAGLFCSGFHTSLYRTGSI